MSSLLNPERRLFFEPTVKTISRVLNLPASIWLLDESGQYLRMEAATRNLDKLMRDAVIDLSEPCVTTEVFKTRKTYIVQDVASEARWQYKAETLQLNLKSVVVVPLLIKKKVEGVLYLYIPARIDFRYGGKYVIVDSFAEQIASTYRQIRSLEMLNEVGRLISSELQNLEVLYNRIMHSAQRVLDCRQVSIFILNKETGCLALEATSSPALHRTRFGPGEGLAGQVFQTGQSVRVADVRDHPHYVTQSPPTDRKERSMLVVPIRLEEKVIGVISADVDGLNGFDEHDHILLEALASQATIAIRNSQFIQKISGQAKALAALNVLAQHLVSFEEYPDTRKLLFKIARSAKEVLQADLIELYEYRQEEREYKLPPVSVGKKLDPSVVAKDIYKDNTLWQVIHRETPLYEEHPQAKHSDFMAPYTIDRKNLPSQRFVIRENIQSTAVIPLRTGNENRGLMFANYRTPQTFPKAQKELIELFANQAAIALKNAELLEKYIEAQKYLENIIDNSPDPIIVIDKNGNIKIFNKACEQLWGYSTGEVYGKHVTDYYESEAHARELGKKLWMSQHNRIENVEARIKTKDGETVPIRLSASFLFNEKKKRIGSVGVFTDLREMKRLEEQKIQAEQLAALGKLAHTVGHDIKHDIGTVLFYIEPLLRQYDRNNDAKLLRIYTNIKDALWDATDKLQNMLQAGKPKAPRKEAGSITDVLRDIEAQMSRQAAARNVKFQIEYPENDCLLHLDQGQMRQVFANLFTNSITALEYRKRHDPSFKKGFIMVSARIIKGRLIIVWQDNGIGIAEEDLPKIFNAFFTRQETDSGTGLGLFIVKSIVENHQGEIHVKSVYGKGASFEIALPAMKSGDEMNQAADGS